MTIREAAKGSAILTMGCLGLAVLMLCALWAARPIYQMAGLVGILAELIALIFLVPFLGAIFGDRFL